MCNYIYIYSVSTPFASPFYFTTKPVRFKIPFNRGTCGSRRWCVGFRANQLWRKGRGVCITMDWSEHFTME